MNLIKGKIVLAAEERDAALDTLEEAILDTLKSNVLNEKLVLDACDLLSKSIGQEHIDLLIKAGIPSEKSREYLLEAKTQLKKENLMKRLKTELGEEYHSEKYLVSHENGTRIKERILPWGTLLHITAGNQFGLAFYSAIEGLLTGNINIVKLPSGDDGLSIMIFSELFKIEPLLKDYIFLGIC
jgi:hypothetical protein